MERWTGSSSSSSVPSRFCLRWKREQKLYDRHRLDQCQTFNAEPNQKQKQVLRQQFNANVIIVPCRIIWRWYTGRWWVGCYILYSEQRSPPRPILAAPNVTAHPWTVSVPIIALLYNDPLLCGFNGPIKGLSILLRLNWPVGYTFYWVRDRKRDRKDDTVHQNYCYRYFLCFFRIPSQIGLCGNKYFFKFFYMKGISFTVSSMDNW